MERSRTYVLAALVAVLLGTGTTGYSLLEGWSLLDSLYMTVITVSTVGFREIGPLSTAGKLFTTGLIVLGVGTLAFAASEMVETLVDRGINHQRRRLMQIKHLRDHVIVCGYGRMGQTVAEQLAASTSGCVVVERDAELMQRTLPNGLQYLTGDATDDEILIAAGVERAKALAVVLTSDTDNLFVTLSARSLNPGLVIIARASDEKSEGKMLRAGATRVLNPYRSGGRLMVRQLLQPAVTEFIDEIQQLGGADICLEEIQVQPESPLAGTMLKDSPIRGEMGVLVLGVRRENRPTVFNPPNDTAPEVGDTLVVLGHRANLRRLERLAAGAQAP